MVLDAVVPDEFDCGVADGFAIALAGAAGLVVGDRGANDRGGPGQPLVDDLVAVARQALVGDVVDGGGDGMRDGVLAGDRYRVSVGYGGRSVQPLTGLWGAAAQDGQRGGGPGERPGVGEDTGPLDWALRRCG